MLLGDKQITTIISDFDGTLLKNGMSEPSDEFFELIKKFLEQGIHFVAASGRQYPNLKRILAPIADKISFIAENGALIIDQGEVVYKNTIQSQLAAEVIHDMLLESKSEILVSGEGTSYIVPNTQEYADLLQIQVKNVTKILDDFTQVPEDILKIAIYYPQGIPSSSELMFHQKYDDELLVVESGNGWLDFMPIDSGKGAALKILSQEIGFSLEESVSFGDSENDISMLQTTGIGYAMESASDRVKENADFVCNSVEEVLKRCKLL